MSECVLVLIADRSAEVELVDWLLAFHEDMVFSSETIDCYGMDWQTLNLAEQVTGRQTKLMFHVQTTLDRAYGIRDGLRRDFPRANLRYWLVPVLEQGEIGVTDAGGTTPDA
jgi:hypothetical protein